jgi:dimethylhistidine N-methyltransferase
MSARAALTVRDVAPHARFYQDVLRGLRRARKEIPCKYFYDARGSELFERICTLPEYYLTRAELTIMRHSGAEMAARLGRRCLLIEYGSGSSLKTRILLNHLVDPVAYVPVDISRAQLLWSAFDLKKEYPTLELLPVCADFQEELELPAPSRPAARRVVYFPGSTIGNLTPDAALAFLRGVRRTCGEGGGLLVGVDLKKDPAILHAAYNDAEGVTRLFNLNLLERINRELDGHFAIERFEHRAVFNEERGRIEMHLVSREAQTVRIGEASIVFRSGESIVTEYSYKYTLDEFAALAARAELTPVQIWTDPERLFSVQYLRIA